MFDDDADGGSGEESKVQTWSSQYQRADPVVVVTNGGSSAVDTVGEPLLLPLRSLKKSRSQNSETNGSVVLPSPIPWRSRSGRMEINDEGSAINSNKVASRTPSFRSVKARSPPSPSLSPEIWAKTNEDPITEKCFFGGSTPLVPAPPPPPPPHLGHGSVFFDKREVKKSFKDELKDLSQKGREGYLSSSHQLDEIPSSLRSVRTVRSKEPPMADTSARMSPDKSAERAPTTSQPKHQTEKKKKVGFMEKMIIVSDDSESENETNPSDVEEADSPPAEAGAAEENEVDKKADEFIAKFREQIRLQRIESIKKSSGHRAGRNPKQQN